MHRFLSAEWVDGVRAIRDEFRETVDGQLAGLVNEAIAVNLVINEMPDGEPDAAAHSVTGPLGSELDLGHLDDATITVTIDYETARSVVVEQDLASIVRAFLFGKLSFEGDIGSLFGDDDGDRDPMALMSALNVAGIQSLGDVDPVAAEIGERIRLITA